MALGSNFMENITNYSNAADLSDTIREGRPLEAIFGIYHETIGIWFIIALIMFTYLILYMKTRSFAIIGIVTIFITPGLMYITPIPMMMTLFVLVVIGVGALIAGLFMKAK